MSFGRCTLLLFTLILVTVGVYVPGVFGGFFFDDYGGLVYNEGLRITDLSLLSLWQGAWSYGQVGPLGRPVAMVSFAIDYWAHGLDPAWAKFENLLIHLLNGCLVYILTVRVIGRAVEITEGVGNKHLDLQHLALFITGWWLIAPLGVTSVLYVIQRMTSLAATFSLLALIGYLHFRERSESTENARWNVAAFFSLLIGTILSAYTKESGLLTIGFAWLLEVVLFLSIKAKTIGERIWRFSILCAPLIVASAFVAFLLQNNGWLETRVPGRDFSPWERLLSQGRIIVFYFRQIVFPDIQQFGLYHDDFIVSKNLFDPPSTLLSIFLHAVLLIVALALRRSSPLIALGIGWFYMGHLLESTVWPLELIHEHRNYLPMWGVMIALAWIMFKLSAGLPVVRLPLAVAVLLAFSAVTLSRTHGMGAGGDYFLNEARLHPASARANYDAAVVLLKQAQHDPAQLGELATSIAAYLDASKHADKNALAPFLGEITLSVMQNQRQSQVIAEFESRLRYGVPPNAIHMIFLGLMEILDEDSASFSSDDMEKLFVAALANPELSGVSRTSVQANYGVFLAHRRQDVEGAKLQFKEVLARTPSATEVRLIYADFMISQGDIEEARRQVQIAKSFDKLGYHKKNINQLSQALDIEFNDVKN